ncbi:MULTISPECIES: YciI family protein [Prochlorococcus]|uniref:YciI family protein n=1 Tax=Prochlorococcus TaxID=1218 RepID=UPI0005338773|nr:MULTISPECIES: YciI family protein [Prochlorococcus]KGG12813.1 hypothetical protein EV05_0484 [Prochlorococcus sp. MIT 0601]
MELFVLYGRYCENALEKRVPFRKEHLERLGKLKKEGTIITLGPTKCNKYVFGIFKSTSLEEVRTILENDIYYKKGIWISLDIYSWIQAF